jgi:hypothetical protein
VLPSTTCHAPTPHRAADIKTTNMATARRIAIQYAADQRTAERFAAACSPRLPQWTNLDSGPSERTASALAIALRHKERCGPAAAWRLLPGEGSSLEQNAPLPAQALACASAEGLFRLTIAGAS